MLRSAIRYTCVIIVALALGRCSDVARQPAIDARVSLLAPESAEPLLKEASQELVGKMVLVAQDPRRLGKKAPLATLADPNAVVFAAAKRFPDRYSPFPVLYLEDLDRVTHASTLIQAGAKGFLILRSRQPVSAVSLEDPIYGVIASQKLPVIIPIDTTSDRVALERVLAAYPGLSVICPEFCGLVGNPAQLSALLARYSNLYTDTGFSDVALEKSILRLSRDPAPLRELIIKHADRFLFASGMTVTPPMLLEARTVADRLLGGRRLLEKAHYDFPVLARRFKNRGMRLPIDGTLNGLFLPRDVLAKVFYENTQRLIGATPGK